MGIKTLTDADLNDLLCVVVGIRPNIVKQSPLVRALQRRDLPYVLIHTGQHYSYEMDQAFFEDLRLPPPDFRVPAVHAHSGHGAQTAAMVAGIEEILLKVRPRLVLVGGDSNTDLAGGLAARKLHIPVAHVEAGLRSYDWRMPEEHNRVMLDHISELLFSPIPNASAILQREHVRGAIVEVGSTAVDAVLQHVQYARETSQILDELELVDGEYAILTVHREENADSPQNVAGILDGVAAFARQAGIPVVFPAHPRTRQRMERFCLASGPGVMVVEPVGYLDFLRLLSGAALLFTDSGGAQQEACVLQIPCLTLRKSTEWIETVTVGANVVVGTDSVRIADAGIRAISAPHNWPNPYGDGTSGEQVIEASLEAIAQDFPLAPPPADFGQFMAPGRVDEVAL